MRRERALLFVALLSGASVTLGGATGCGKKTVKSAVDWQKKVPYERGTVFQHLPAECASAFLYVDLKASLKNEATAAAMDIVGDKLSGDFSKTKADRKQLGALKKMLHEQGLEPLRDTHEIAVCWRGNDEGFIAVFGGDYSGKDALAAVQKTVEDGGEEPPPIETVRGTPVILLGKLAIARVSGNIIAIGEDLATMGRLRTPVDRSKQFGWEAGDLVVGRLGGDNGLRLEVRDRGAEVELHADGKLDLTKQALEDRRELIGTRLGETPLKMLADPIRKTQIEIEGGRATFVLRAPTKTIGDAVRIASELGPSDLKKMLGFVLAPANNEQKI